MEQTGLRHRAGTDNLRVPTKTNLKPSTTPKKNSCFKFCKLSIFLIVGTLLFLYLYNLWVLSSEAKRFGKPPLGQMVKLGKGHSLYLNCQGKKDPNKPIVVLVMGFLMSEVGWYGCQKTLVEEGWHVCTYDRSGMGWSEPDPDLFVTVQGFVDELHELIEVSGISKNPSGYVLVGLSMGASISARYIEHWPTEPKGGYIIDPPLDDPNSTMSSVFLNIKKTFQIFHFLAEYGFLRPLWYFGKLHPLSVFITNTPTEITDPYLYLAAKPKGYYFGVLHELELLNPGHGHFSNESTFEFIAKYDKIPIQVELRESAFMHGLGDDLNKEWYTTRQKLKAILGNKQHTFMEDHLGKLSADEPLSQSLDRTNRRILKFLETWK